MMSAAVWVPGQRLRFRRLPWEQFEDLAGGKYGSATARVTLWRGGAAANNLKMLASDVAMVFPDEFPAHEADAAEFVVRLGGPVQPWRGTLVVYAIDSPEGGWPQSVTGAQRSLIVDAYRAATGGDPDPDDPDQDPDPGVSQAGS